MESEYIERVVQVAPEINKVLDQMEHAATPFLNDALYLYLGAVGALRSKGLRLAFINEDNSVHEVLMSLGGEANAQEDRS